MSTDSNFNRILSRIFTNPTFKSIVKFGEGEYLIQKLKKYNNYLSVQPCETARDILKQAYTYLSSNYRNEYIYKNTIANKIILGRHNLNTTTLLSEFKVGGSIADMLMLNGTSTVYEIKTELDSPEKLLKQIGDYKKAFTKIYLVTHHSLSQKYLQFIENSNVGLLSLNSKFQLSVHKEANAEYDCLDNFIMLRCLRKPEYTAIIKKHFGVIPLVSNIKYFTICQELVQNINPIEFHSLMLEELKKRCTIEKEFIYDDKLPFELKHICLCLNPSKTEYNNLFKFLNKPL